MNIKVVIRNLFKHPFLNLVKIIGLGLALSGIVFISLFLKSELTYDRHHDKSNRIYRITLTDPDFLGGKHFARIVNPGYLPDVKERLPEVLDFVRLRPVRGGLINHKERYSNVTQGFECDSTFFQVFKAELVVGNKQTVLENPASMVVAESFAQKIFGQANPVGEVLTLPAGQYYGQTQNFTIAGVMKDFPAQSHFHPDFVTTPVQDQFQFGWAWTYLVLAEGANTDNVRTGISDFLIERAQIDPEEMDTKVHLQKLTDIHLHSNKLREIEANGNMRNIYVLAIAALILLLISIINYANLNIGMAGFNAKYLFINKLLGSSKRSVTGYFFTEGVFIVGASVLLALMISVPINSIVIRLYNLNLLEGNFYSVIFILTFFTLLSLFFGMLPVLKSVFSSVRLGANRNTSPLIGKNG
ncbi:MAG: ABC transporter permease, partial [Draconibacterium sp.]|nr:ABC transporter permease [Draconibacterium sp.]